MDDIGGSNATDTIDANEGVEQPGRGHRKRKPCKKVRDLLPEGPRQVSDGINSVAPENAPSSAADASIGTSAEQSRLPRIILRVTEYVQIARNAFGMWRQYVGRSLRISDIKNSISTIFKPLASSAAAASVSKTIEEIIAPFPNISL